MKIATKNMLALADRAGKISAVYIPASGSNPDLPQIALVPGEHQSVYDVEIPHQLLNAVGVDVALLSRYRIHIEGAKASLVLHNPKD